MPKKRKQTEAAVQTIEVGPAARAMDYLLIGRAAGILQNFGFRQIVPSPIEDRKVFSKDPDLALRFAERLLEVHGLPGREAVLPPTYMFGILREYAEKLKLEGPGFQKWFYVAPTVQVLLDDRVDVTHELGIFLLGEESALANAHLINAVSEFFSELGITGFVTEINSIGCKTCQKDYFETVQDHLLKGGQALCADCAGNLKQHSAAVWNCPNFNAGCRQLLADAPQIVDFLDEYCRAGLIGVLETLDELSIPYSLSPGLTGMFLQEKVLFQVNLEDSLGYLGHGGNYSSWTQYAGGAERFPALGFRTTLDTLHPFVPHEKKKAPLPVEVFMIPVGEIACRRAMVMHRELLAAGIKAAEAMLGNGGIKNQLREAIDHKSEIALIIGQKEAIDETVILRDMRSGMQEVFAWDRTIEEVKKRLGK